MANTSPSAYSPRLCTTEGLHFAIKPDSYQVRSYFKHAATHWSANIRKLSLNLDPPGDPMREACTHYLSCPCSTPYEGMIEKSCPPRTAFWLVVTWQYALDMFEIYIYIYIYTYKRVVCVCWSVCWFVCFLSATRHLSTLRRCLRVLREQPSHRGQPRARAGKHAHSGSTRAHAIQLLNEKNRCAALMPF